MNTRDLRSLLIALSCSTALAAPVFATEGKQLHIPAGDLVTALETLAKQSGAELVYQTDQVKGLHTDGVQGDFTLEQAINRLLKGTALTVRTDSSGAMLITSATAPMGSADAPTEAPPANPTQAAAVTENPASRSDESTSAEGGKGLQEVVVTGTLIRGIQAAGASVVTLDNEAIAATGATSSDDVLRNIPQLAEFGNTNQQISTVNLQVTVDRPNIRNLPGVGTNGGSTTLVLVDGHRLVGEGIKETAPDPNTVPVALLDRVEVLPVLSGRQMRVRVVVT
jgi:iron complex outermembrane recepter protein